MNSLDAAVLFADTDALRGQDLPLRASFNITTEVEPEVLCRLLSYFTQLGLVPERIVACQHNDLLQVTIEQLGLSLPRANVIAQKMRSQVSVFEVALELTSESPDSVTKAEMTTAAWQQDDAFAQPQNRQVTLELSQQIAG